MQPDFLSQNGELSSSSEMLEWFNARRKEAADKGAIHHRYSVHPTYRNLILYEGWKEIPWDETGRLNEGGPRWQFSAT